MINGIQKALNFNNFYLSKTCAVITYAHYFQIYIITNDMEPNIRYSRREHLADVTEIYNKLNSERKKLLFKVAYLVAVFVIAVVRYYSRNAHFL